MKSFIRDITILWIACLLFCALFSPTSAWASQGNIDSLDKYAWSENAGWLNFRPTHGGVTVHESFLSGYAWAENIGWVKMGSGVGPYDNNSSTNWGVNRNSSTGALSGYAWSETARWVNFNPTHSQVIIDPSTGSFEGYAWSENLGWIHFKNSSPAYNVVVTADAIITSFTPASGGQGTSVIITGTHFTEATAVRFGGTDAASFTIDSSTQITAVVGSGSAGKVTVTTSEGTATSSTGFIFFDGTFNYTLPSATELSIDRHIFTVPLTLGTGTDMLTAMEAVLGVYDPYSWRVFAFNGANYIEINTEGFAALSIIPGMGFWIITQYTETIPFQGGLAPDGVDYEITLPPGWNLVALPWISTNIDLGNITVSDGENEYPITSVSNTLTQRSLWDYTGSGPYDGYEKRNASSFTLQCGTAYFIKVLVDSNVTLIIPLDNGSGSASVQPYRDTEGPISEDDEEEPPPPPGGEPVPDIKANGQDGPVTVPYGTPVSIAVNLAPGAWANRNVDWWVAAYTPSTPPDDLYTYVYPAGWYPGAYVCIQTPLVQLSSPLEVLNTALPIGDYSFYFAVDGNADGVPDVSWVDSVEVKVE